MADRIFSTGNLTFEITHFRILFGSFGGAGI